MRREPGPITLEEASRFTARARAAAPLPVRGWAYPADLLRRLMDQEGATGVRMYLGLTDEDEYTLVLVAIDGTGSDLAEGLLLEYSWPCPPVCPDDSPLLAGR